MFNPLIHANADTVVLVNLVSNIMVLVRCNIENKLPFIQANFMIIQLIIATHFKVSAIIGGLLQERNFVTAR